MGWREDKTGEVDSIAFALLNIFGGRATATPSII